jgi:glutathione S-transferase
MKLLYTPRSPYVRKVRVTLIETGLHKSIEFVEVNLEHPIPELARRNPLGKVPTLVRDDGVALFDSPVVCEYLDSLHKGPKLYPTNEARWVALRQLALADGILDALTSRRHEARRPDGERSADYMKKQQEKSDRGLAELEREADRLAGPITIGQIAAGCCLGYLDFRFAKEPWRAGHPNLARWFEEFAKRPSMVETMPPSGGH